jgi:hypothetical protein
VTDQGSVLKFPSARPAGKPDAKSPEPVWPKLNQYTREEALSIYEIASSVKKKGEDFVAVVEQNPSIARQAGVEMLAVQLTSILESDKFQRVMEALQESVFQNAPLRLTNEGADKISRLEKITADVDHFVISFMNGRKVEPTMGQAQAALAPTSYPVYVGHNSDGISMWLPLVIIGVAGIVGVIAIVALTRQSRK